MQNPIVLSPDEAFAIIQQTTGVHRQRDYLSWLGKVRVAHGSYRETEPGKSCLYYH
jgi:hypothetical protein